MNVIEEQLTGKLADDLDGTFQDLVLTYQNRLYSFALRLTGSPRDAEEIAQDVFVSAYRAIKKYEAERVRLLALRSWLYRITLNTARNHRRGMRREMISLDQDENRGVLEHPDDDALRPEAITERVEAKEQLARAVASLPVRYREAVVLRFVEGMPYAEMAEVLGQPTGTAKANVHRGIKMLRNKLAQQNWFENVTEGVLDGQ